MSDKKLEDFIDEVENIDQAERIKRFEKRAKDGHVLNLLETVLEQDGVDELLSPLSDEDQHFVMQEVSEVAEPWQELMDKLLTQFGTEESRQEFVKAAKAHYSKKF